MYIKEAIRLAITAVIKFFAFNVNVISYNVIADESVQYFPWLYELMNNKGSLDCSSNNLRVWDFGFPNYCHCFPSFLSHVLVHDPSNFNFATEAHSNIN